MALDTDRGDRVGTPDSLFVLDSRLYFSLFGVESGGNEEYTRIAEQTGKNQYEVADNEELLNFMGGKGQRFRHHRSFMGVGYSR